MPPSRSRLRTSRCANRTGSVIGSGSGQQEYERERVRQGALRSDTRHPPAIALVLTADGPPGVRRSPADGLHDTQMPGQRAVCRTVGTHHIPSAICTWHSPAGPATATNSRPESAATRQVSPRGPGVSAAQGTEYGSGQSGGEHLDLARRMAPRTEPSRLLRRRPPPPGTGACAYPPRSSTDRGRGRRRRSARGRGSRRSHERACIPPGSAPDRPATGNSRRTARYVAPVARRRGTPCHWNGAESWLTPGPGLGKPAPEGPATGLGKPAIPWARMQAASLAYCLVNCTDDRQYQLGTGDTTTTGDRVPATSSNARLKA